MATLTKDLLRPGRYFPPGWAEPLVLTPADLAGIERNAAAMAAAGFRVPVCWEHQPHANPYTAADLSAERAKNFIGDALRMRRTPDGRLEFVADIPDENDARQAEKVRSVSPGLRYDWRTGDGKVYPGWSVVHVAVTPVPVNPDQRPFARLGLVALSLSDLETPMDGDTPTTDTAPATASADKLKEAVEALASAGYILGDDTDATNFFDRVIVAIKTKQAAGDPALADEYDDDNGDPAAPPEGAEPPPGVAGGLGAAALSLAQTKLLDYGRKDLERRVTRLVKTGRVTPKVGAKLAADLKAADLSLTDAGDVKPHAVTLKIEAFEELDGVPTGRRNNAPADLSLATVPERPANPQDGLTEAQAEKVVDSFFAG